MQKTKLRDKVLFRRPCIEDGPKIWSLTRDIQTLDLNSGYCYLSLCRHFADTCVVAEHEGELIGFVTAYRPPLEKNVLFVWQIGVAIGFHRQGVGLSMLLELLQRDACREVFFVETTITQTNSASRALFASFQKRLSTHCRESPCFSEKLFPERNHEAEHLLRIGPLNLSHIR